MGSVSDGGYATPTAMVISMALGLVAAAVVARSLSEYRLAKQDFARTQSELEMDAAQSAALLAIMTSSQPPPYRWVMPSLGEAIAVLAEPETSKLSFSAAAQLDGSAMEIFKVADAAALSARLAASSPDQVWVAEQDPSAVWRRCAASYVSSFGQAEQIVSPNYHDPLSGGQSNAWHSGEVWRIVVAKQDGWRDERIVRFTGDGNAPAAVIDRRVRKTTEDYSTCDTLFG